MTFLEFLKKPSNRIQSLGFFSPEYLLRDLFYKRLKDEAKINQGEFHFHKFSEMKSLEKIISEVGQKGLFTTKKFHCIFFDKQDLKSSLNKKMLKTFSNMNLSETLPLFFVGGFTLLESLKKLFGPNICFLKEPKFSMRSELKEVFEHLKKKQNGIESATFEEFAASWDIHEGDLTQSFYHFLRKIFEGEGSKNGGGKAPFHAQGDLFTYSKKVCNSSAPISEIIEGLGYHLVHGGDWYPFLGILHKFARSRPKRSNFQVLKAIEKIDELLKHYQPASRLDQVFVFSIILLRKSFQEECVVL